MKTTWLPLILISTSCALCLAAGEPAQRPARARQTPSPQGATGKVDHYIVYDGGELLDWGFFDNRWKLSSAEE